MATISDFLKDACNAGRSECFYEVVNRWPPLEGLTNHGVLIGRNVLERIVARIHELRWETEHLVTKPFELFLKRKCTEELEALRIRVESYSLTPADNEKDRDERIRSLGFCPERLRELLLRVRSTPTP